MISIRRMIRYEEYILTFINGCLEKEEPVPDWTWDARNILSTLYHLDAELKKPSLSKACLDDLAAFERHLQTAEQFPPGLEAYVREAGSVIRELYVSLTERPEEFFEYVKSHHTLSKAGRKAVRECRKKLLKIPQPELPRSPEELPRERTDPV